MLLVPITVLPWMLHLTGPVYGVSAFVLGLVFLASVIGVAFDKQDTAGVSLTKDKPAKLAFKVSLYYLFVLFAALAVDHWVG